MNLDRIESFPREDILLAFMAAIPASLFGPAQLQKGMFLVSKQMPDVFDTAYDFQPGTTGPTDFQVEVDLDSMVEKGLARIVVDPASTTFVRFYLATPAGVRAAIPILANMWAKNAERLETLSQWVLNQTFNDLVAAVIREHPEMAMNMPFLRGQD